jgi:hypothetical protein
MRLKVELSSDVVWFVRHRCNAEEQDAFYQGLEAVRSDPIEQSEATADPRVSQYILRFFRFGANLALFEFDPGRDQIRVLECRKLPPRGFRPRERAGPGGRP